MLYECAMSKLETRNSKVTDLFRTEPKLLSKSEVKQRKNFMNYTLLEI